MSNAGWYPRDATEAEWYGQQLQRQARAKAEAEAKALAELKDLAQDVTAYMRESSARLALAELRQVLAAAGGELRVKRATPSIKAGAVYGTITGYASKWDEVDSYSDVMVRGAFKATLAAARAKGRLPAMLWSHSSSEPCGAWTSMEEDDVGLRVSGTLALSTQRGAEAMELLKIGGCTGLSIGYRLPPGGSTWDATTRTNKITAVDLLEVSLVAMPAVDSARIDGLKSRPADEALDRLLATARQLTTRTR